MNFKVINSSGTLVNGVDFSTSLFDITPRSDILSRVVTWQLAKKQSGIHQAKGRSDVIGSTRKIYKQKGTGNARHGNKKAPQFRGGGVAFGPSVRSHAFSLPKKIRKLGLRMAIAAKIQEEAFYLVDSFSFPSLKTKDFLKTFSFLSGSSVLLVDKDSTAENLKHSISNIFYFDFIPQIGMNVYDILKKDKLVITLDALKALEERLQ